MHVRQRSFTTDGLISPRGIEIAADTDVGLGEREVFTPQADPGVALPASLRRRGASLRTPQAGPREAVSAGARSAPTQLAGLTPPNAGCAKAQERHSEAACGEGLRLCHKGLVRPRPAALEREPP
jgi:hypothetical protein